MGSGSTGFFGSVHNVLRKESVVLRENVSWIKLQRNNKKPIKLKDEQNVLFWSAMLSLRSFVLERTAKPSNALRVCYKKVLGKLRTTFMKLVGVSLANTFITLRY